MPRSLLPSSSILTLALSLGALPLSACMGDLGPGLADSALVLSSPLDGAYVPSRDVRVEGTALTQTVVVNGVSVPVASGHFSTVIHAADEGPLRVSVEALGEHHQVGVIVDSIPPELTLTAPLLPALIDGATFEIRGGVHDDSPIEVTIDGAPVTTGPDGTFSWSQDVAPGAHRVRLVVKDAAGHTVRQPVAAIVGDLPEYGTTADDALALTLGPSAFDELNVGLNDILNSDAFRQSLRDRLVGGYGDLTIRGIEYGTADVSILPNAGGLAARAQIHDVRVAARGCVDALITDICKNVDLTTSNLEVTADLGVDVADGALTVATRSADVTLHGFDFDVSGIPGFIEDLFRGRARREIESQGRDAITDMLSDQLPRLLGDLSLRADAPVLGSALVIDATFNTVELDDTGMHVRLDVSTWSDAAFEDRMTYAFLRIPHAGLTRTDASGVSLQTSLDALNSACFSVWSGFTPYDVGVVPGLDGPLSVNELGLVTGSQRALEELAPADAPVGAAIDLALPPVVTQDDLDGGLRITLADARVALSARDPSAPVGLEADPGSSTPLVTLSVFLSAPVDVVTDEMGLLRLQVGEPTLHADAIDAPPGFATGDELDRLLEGLTPQLTAALGGIDGIALPSVVGFQFGAPMFSSGDGQLRVDADLRYAGGGSISF
ncbi:MAG: hypothetical protein AB7S26_01580 [Sandaracinaceae bacterium]